MLYQKYRRTSKLIHIMNLTELKEWQDKVSEQIAALAEDRTLCLSLLQTWPALRSWAKSAKPEKVSPVLLVAYLKDALTWSQTANVVVIKQEKTTRKPVKDSKTPSNSGKKPNKQTTTKQAPAESKQGDDTANNPTFHYDKVRHMMPEEVDQRYQEISEAYLLRTELAQRRDSLADEIEELLEVGDFVTLDEKETLLSEVATQLVGVDQLIRQFWVLVDTCVQYYSLNGDIMPMDELNKIVPAKVVTRRRTPDIPKSEIELMEDKDEAETCKADRIRKNKNFLRDARKEHTDEWKAQMALRYSELKEWGESITAKQKELLAEAGVEL